MLLSFLVIGSGCDFWDKGKRTLEHQRQRSWVFVKDLHCLRNKVLKNERMRLSCYKSQLLKDYCTSTGFPSSGVTLRCVVQERVCPYKFVSGKTIWRCWRLFCFLFFFLHLCNSDTKAGKNCKIWQKVISVKLYYKGASLHLLLLFHTSLRTLGYLDSIPQVLTAAPLHHVHFHHHLWNVCIRNSWGNIKLLFIPSTDDD